MDDEAGAVGLGLFIGIVLAVTFAFVFNYTNTRHDIGWNHVVCVKTTDKLVEGGATTTEHCISAQDIAKWAQEHNR